MTRNTYLIIGLVVVLLVAGFLFIKQKGGNEAQVPTGAKTVTESPTSTSPSPAPTASTNQAETKTVTYTDAGFSPQSLTIRAGDTVVFKNNSNSDFWPASAPHPTHTNYPEFDAKRAIPAGSSYSFTFTKIGSWKYHNHLNPSLTGTITVQ